MDDLQEQETADLRNLGQFCFISCWTENDEESIPMWKMYGRMDSGIRIKMRTCPFLEKENRPEELEFVSGHMVEDKTGGKYIKSLITASEMWEKRIASTGLVQQKDILFEVEYTRDKDKLYPKLLSQNGSNTTIELGKLGKYKNEGWSFQKEWRYRLLLFPLDMTDMEKAADNGIQMMTDIIRGVAALPFTFYDMEMDIKAFEEMEVTLSPQISTGNRIIVRDLIEKYNPNARIIDSIYMGLIR